MKVTSLPMPKKVNHSAGTLFLRLVSFLIASLAMIYGVLVLMHAAEYEEGIAASAGLGYVAFALLAGWTLYRTSRKKLDAAFARRAPLFSWILLGLLPLATFVGSLDSGRISSFELYTILFTFFPAWIVWGGVRASVKRF